MKIKRNQILNLMLFIFTTISLIVLYFDLGKANFGIYISSTINSVVPSIEPTAAIAQATESSALILALSWLMVILSTLVMVVGTNWKVINYEEFYKKLSGWFVFGVFILIPILIIFTMFNIPQDNGRFGRFIYINLKEFKLFIILYGAGIWLSLSAGLFAAVFISVSAYLKNFKKG